MEVNRGVWSEAEHDRFLVAIQTYPHGPWRLVAEHVGTRDIRQVQTHAQKYYEKMGRHLRGLQKERRSWVRPEHRVDDMPPGLQRPSVRQSITGASTATTTTFTTTTETVGVDVSTATTAATTTPTEAVVVDAIVTVPQDQDGETSGVQVSMSTDMLTGTTLDSAAQLPTLEESLDILLQCLTDY